MLGPSWDGNLLSLAENSGIGTFMMFQGASIGQPRVSPQIVRSPLQGGEGKPTSITVFLKLCDVNLCVCMCVCVCVCVCVAQSCPSLCDSVDYSSPGSSVHGLQILRIHFTLAVFF